MASLPESSTFDAGVYQLELTDPVIGGPSGVSNTPLKNLANRTKYLKDHVDALEASRAPLASPALTGAPTAPTAAAGTNTTQLATTAFVQTEIAADMAANLATASPLMDGTAAVGVATKMAREDHRHPTDNTRAPLASPAFTGTPTAPNAATGARSQQLATMQKFEDEFLAAKLSNGYQKLPSGVIIQWGYFTIEGQSNTANISFPIAFPSECRSITFADYSTANSNGAVIWAFESYGRTGFIPHWHAGGVAPGSTLRTGFYIAIGY